MTVVVPNVAIIIVTYGHAAVLPTTLAAFERLDYPATQRDIIVVENGDGSSATVARRYPFVRVLEPGRNLGFAAGCNLGVTQSTGDVIVLLNPDTEPQPRFLRQIVAPLTDPSVGIVGAKLRLSDGQTLQHAGGFLTEPLAFAQHYGYGEMDQGQWDTPRDVEFVTGAALAIRRSTWEQFGGLDTDFFPGYFEEVDLCWRIARHNLVVRFEPSAVAIHQEAAALGKRSIAYHHFYHRNRLRLLFKHRTDEWLIQNWLPAELTHLRTTADDAEISGLQQVYLFWQSAFLSGVEPSAWEVPTSSTSQPHTSELEWTLQQVTAKRMISAVPFRSRLPFVARVRSWLNRVVTEDYLRPILQQQNDYNASVAELGHALARQRRTADAAILCQGMMLAKMLRRTA